MAKKLECPYCGHDVSQKQYRAIFAKVEQEAQAETEKARKAAEQELVRERALAARDLIARKKEAEQEIARQKKAAKQELAGERKTAERRWEQEKKAAELKLAREQKAAENEVRRMKLAADKIKADKEKAGKERKALLDEQKKFKEDKKTLRAQLKKEFTDRAGKEIQAAREEQKRADEDAIRKASGREDQLRKKVEDLSRKLSDKTQDEFGSWQEEDLAGMLTQAFPRDNIERVGKGRRGADVVQIVMENGRELGTIIYESKNVSQWSNAFVDKAVGYRRQYVTPHVVIVSNRFPGKEKEFCVRKGVSIVSPARVVHLAHVLRDAVVAIGKLELSMDARTEKVDEIYKYLRSAEFKQQLAGVETACAELRKLQTTEKDWHSRHWTRQEKQHKFVDESRREIDTAISEILEQEAEGKPGKVLKLARG